MDRNPLYEDAAIIADASAQKRFLRYRAAYPDAAFSLFTPAEALSLFRYCYDERAVVALLEQGYGLCLALDMLKAMAYMKSGQEYASKKLRALAPLFARLRQQGLLYAEPSPERHFANRKVILAGLPAPQALIDRLREAGVKKEDIIDETMKTEGKAPPTLLEFDDIHAEVAYVCNRIAALLDQGVAPGDIFLADYSLSYRFEFEVLAPSYGFAIAYPQDASLLEWALGREFLKAFEQAPSLEEALASLQRRFPADPDLPSLRLLAGRYQVPGFDKKRQRDLYAQLLARGKKAAEHDPNAIAILGQDSPPAGSHVFYLDFCLATSPRVLKDDDYLSDEEKLELGMATSQQENELARRRLLALLACPELCCLSYKAYRRGEESHPSPLLSDLRLPTVQNKEEPYQYSRLYARMLAGEILDRERKYGNSDPRRDFLVGEAQADLCCYTPEFVPYAPQLRRYGEFDPKRQRRYSYSSVNAYYQCPFRYYLGSILRLDDSDVTWRSKVGELFHGVFARMHEADFVLEDAFAQERAKMEEKPEYGLFSPKERVLLTRLEEECAKVVDFLRESEAGMAHPSFRCEFQIDAALSAEVGLTGRIDKAITLHPPGEKSYVAFVDYKTGAAAFDEALLPHGLSLQLPIYSYLASQDERYRESELLGLFIQPAIPGRVVPGKGNTYEREFAKNVRMQGVYLSDVAALRNLDSSISAPSSSSRLIAGLRLNKDDGFPANLARNKPASKLKEYGEQAKAKILQADAEICQGHFPIEPKYCKGKVDACEYCAFRDVCYVREQFRKILKLENDEEEEK